MACTADLQAGFAAPSPVAVLVYVDYVGEAILQGGGTVVGYTNRYQNSGTTDAAAITIDFSNGTYLFAYNTSNWGKFTSTQSGGADVVGETICFSGGQSDQTSCGTLLSKNWSGYMGGVYHYGLRHSDFYAIGGDSGGPVWAGYQLKGILTGGASDYDNKYTHVSNILSNLNLNALLGY